METVHLSIKDNDYEITKDRKKNNLLSIQTSPAEAYILLTDKKRIFEISEYRTIANAVNNILDNKK